MFLCVLVILQLRTLGLTALGDVRCEEETGGLTLLRVSPGPSRSTYLALSKALNVGLLKAFFKSPLSLARSTRLRSDFPRCSRTVSVTDSNRRVRTRTHGGVAGVGG